MKTKKLQFSAEYSRMAVLLFTVLIFTACVGPRGPRGYDGEDGFDGINYTHTAIYDVEAVDWEGDADGYFVWLEIPEITQDIYYEGAVLVYRLIEVAPYSFNMLPYTYVDNDFTISMDFDAYVGGIELIYKEVLAGVNDTFAPEDLMTFKVVIIEGVPLAKVKEMVDIRDFNAVVKTFKIDVNKTGYQKF